MATIRQPYSALALSLLLAGLGSGPALGTDALASMAAAIGSTEGRRAIAGVATRARCDGPQGAFETEIVALDEGTARFVQSRGERRSELLASGGAAFQRGAGGAIEAAPEAALEIVHGHAVHRLLLDLDRHAAAGPATAQGCLPLRGPGGLAFAVCPAPEGGLPARLEIALSAAAGGETVVVELADWRPLLGVRLPFVATFVQGGQRFVHRYQAVLPFRLAPGASLPAEPAALAARLGDLAALAASHEEVLAAHRASDVERLLAGGGEASLGSHRGVLAVTDRQAMRERLGPYLAATRFSRYEDVAVPAVAVALDGSLGWLACQIEAEGEQRDAVGQASPLAFGFSWVELYARDGDRFRAIGNASSLKP